MIPQHTAPGGDSLDAVPAAEAALRPTTDTRHPRLGDQDRDMAAILLDLADRAGGTRVGRAAIRAEWVRDYPEHRQPDPYTHLRARPGHQPDGLDGNGRAARRHVGRALAHLDQCGLILRAPGGRDDDTVVIVDRAGLEHLAELPPASP